MVLAGAYPSRELAACCSVDVMKGARGSRFASDSFTSFTVQGLLFPAFKILSTSLFSVGSFSQIKAISSPFFVLVLAVIIQNVCEMNALISRLGRTNHTPPAGLEPFLLPGLCASFRLCSWDWPRPHVWLLW